MTKTTWMALAMLAALGLSSTARAQNCGAFSYAPAQGGYGLVEFEDLWPVTGDLDFNDENTAYNYVFVYDTDNNLIGMQATFHVVSIGASIRNGLYLQLPLDPSLIASAQISIGNSPGAAVEPVANLPHLPSACAQSLVTYPIAADTRSLYAGASGFINTTTNQPILADAAVSLSISFAQPLATSSDQGNAYLDIGQVPFDLFLARTTDGSHQIHLPTYDGHNSCADPTLFGTGDDGSNRDLTGSGGADNRNRYYVDSKGLPFGLNIPQYVDWAIERTPSICSTRKSTPSP